LLQAGFTVSLPYEATVVAQRWRLNKTGAGCYDALKQAQKLYTTSTSSWLGAHSWLSGTLAQMPISYHHYLRNQGFRMSSRKIFFSAFFALHTPMLALAQETEEEPTSAPVEEPTSSPAQDEIAKPPAREENGLLSFQLEQPASSVFYFERDVAGYEFDFNLYVQLQLQIAAFVGNETFLEDDSAAIDEGYRVHRARVGVWGDLDEFGYVLTADLRDETLPDASGLDARPVGARLLDAAVNWHRYPFAIVTVGANKLPFSRGGMASSFTTTFQQQPFTTSRLVPSRRAGLSVSGNVAEGKVFYSVGQYNTSNSLSFGSLGGGLITIGRLELSPMGPIDPNQSGPRPFDGTRASLGFNGYFTGRAEAQDIQAAGADLLVQSGPVTLLVEGIFSRIVPVAEPVLPGGAADITNRFGAYGQLGFMVKPDRFEVAVRGEYFDDNLVLKDEGDILGLSGTFNIMAYENRIRTSFDYTSRIELQGVNLKNDIFLIQTGARF
jgi:hypothetical protein